MPNADMTIIMATFNQPDYLEQCMDSLFIQPINFNVDVLIGVDACQKTKDMVAQRASAWNLRNPKISVKCYYFHRNSGPFVIKNQLSSLVKTKYIFFFDSDDILAENALQQVYDHIQSPAHQTYIVLLQYVNFQVEHGQPKVSLKMRQAMGVFLIQTDVFRSSRGFYPWRFGADSELQRRLQYSIRNPAPSVVSIAPTFLRRIHSESLSISDKTGFKSTQRLALIKLLEDKRRLNHWPHPPALGLSVAVSFHAL